MQMVHLPSFLLSGVDMTLHRISAILRDTTKVRNASKPPKNKKNPERWREPEGDGSADMSFSGSTTCISTPAKRSNTSEMHTSPAVLLQDDTALSPLKEFGLRPVEKWNAALYEEERSYFSKLIVMRPFCTQNIQYLSASKQEDSQLS